MLVSVSQQSDLVIDTVSKVTAHCLVSAPVTALKTRGCRRLYSTYPHGHDDSDIALESIEESRASEVKTPIRVWK